MAYILHILQIAYGQMGLMSGQYGDNMIGLRWNASVVPPPPAAKCGDGTCSSGETCSSCPADCGACTTCGDKVCNGKLASPSTLCAVGALFLTAVAHLYREYAPSPAQPCLAVRVNHVWQLERMYASPAGAPCVAQGLLLVRGARQHSLLLN